MPTPLRYSTGRAAAELGATPLRQSSPTTPGPSALLGAPHGDPERRRGTTALPAAVDPEKRPFLPVDRNTPSGSSGPLRGAEQRRVVGGFRLALFEPQASLASRPACRVAQGTGLARRRPRGGLFFGYFLLATQKKVCPPARRKTAHQENRPRVGRGSRRLRRPEPSVRHGTPTRIILYHVPRETPSSVFPPRRSARRARRR